MDQSPLITILIATYNYEKYIGEAITSVISQDYPIDKIEIIVIDDGSKDNTGKVVDGFKDRVNLKYVYQANAGKASATRLGIEMATGKYLFVLDADDYYLPGCLDTVVNIFESDPSLVQVSHLLYRLDEATAELTPLICTHSEINTPLNGEYLIKKKLFNGYSVGMGSTFAGTTKELKELSIPNEIDMYIDYHLFLMMAPKGKVYQSDKILTVFRRHARSYSEGVEKFENAKIRSLRYLKSAKALYEEIIKGSYSTLIKRDFRLFYYSHWLETSKLTQEQSFKIKFEIFGLILGLVWHHKSRLSFLKNNLKLFVR